MTAASDRDAAGPRRRTPVRKRGDAAATRTKLLESARRLADTRSVPDFTVDDVATGAGVSRAAFYLHFENKLAICDEVARTSQAAFIAAATAFERSPDVRTTIHAGIRAYVDGFRGDRPGMRMTYELAYAESGVRQLVHETRATFYALWEAEIGAAVRAGRCAPVDAPVVARLLFGMLETFCVRTMRTNEYDGTSVADRDAVPMIAELWARALLLHDHALAPAADR